MVLLIWALINTILELLNLQYNTVKRWVDRRIVPPPDGAMFIMIVWESLGHINVKC